MLLLLQNATALLHAGDRLLALGLVIFAVSLATSSLPPIPSPPRHLHPPPLRSLDLSSPLPHPRSRHGSLPCSLSSPLPHQRWRHGSLPCFFTPLAAECLPCLFSKVRRLLMGSHHDGDETKGSVYLFVQDYIEAREASGSVRTAGPKDLTVTRTVHWPNSKPWSESRKDGGRSVAVEKRAQSSRRGKVGIQRRGA